MELILFLILVFWIALHEHKEKKQVWKNSIAIQENKEYIRSEIESVRLKEY